MGQYLPADPVDAAVVQAFLAARSPMAWEAYRQARHAQAAHQEPRDRAQQPQSDRLPDHAAWAQRQVHRGAPAHRWVAAALARRGEPALRERQDAQEAYETQRATRRAGPPLAEERRTALQALGQPRPRVWAEGHLTPVQHKAL